jgi:hypothetical protein
MAYATNRLMARIEWCHEQKMHTQGQRESEEWHAEEDGLRDALLNEDHSNRYKSRLPGAYARYLIGLQDGRDMLRVDEAGHQFRQ